MFQLIFILKSLNFGYVPNPNVPLILRVIISSILHMKKLRLVCDYYHRATQIQSVDLMPGMSNAELQMMHCLPLLISHFLHRHLIHYRLLNSRHAWNM